MHSLQKQLETNIRSITVICSVTYSRHLSQSLRCHRHFFFFFFLHLSFYSSFSFSWEKNNVIFLHCNRNTRPNKIEADDSKCTVIYCIFISGLVSFRLWEYESRKKIKWKLTTDFHFFHFSIFREKWKLKINCRFLFFIFKLKKNVNWIQIFIFHFSNCRKNEWL